MSSCQSRRKIDTFQRFENARVKGPARFVVLRRITAGVIHSRCGNITIFFD